MVPTILMFALFCKNSKHLRNNFLGGIENDSRGAFRVGQGEQYGHRRRMTMLLPLEVVAALPDSLHTPQKERSEIGKNGKTQKFKCL